MSIVLARVDDRLIHGQVVVGWAPVLKANHIMIIDNQVAEDPTQCLLYEMAVPLEIKSSILTLNKAVEFFQSNADTDNRTIILFSRPSDVLSFVESGVTITSLNIGGMRYEPGKTQISPSISISDEDKTALRTLLSKGIKIEGRAVPTDPELDIKPFL